MITENDLLHDFIMEDGKASTGECLIWRDEISLLTSAGVTGVKVSSSEPVPGRSYWKGSEDSPFKKFKLHLLSLEILSAKKFDSFSQKVAGFSLRPNGVLAVFVCKILLNSDGHKLKKVVKL